ncbi:hypothetical protein Tco_0268670 [Tanacetum coccineum]
MTLRSTSFELDHVSWRTYIRVKRRSLLQIKSSLNPLSLRARHFVSSSSSQHDDDDDDDDVETSRASTPSPTTYLNSLDPVNYQNYPNAFRF